MKVLHVITLADLGGAQSVVINMVRELVKNGHSVSVASESEGPMWSELPAQVKQYRISELQRSVHPLKDFVVLLKLRKIYKELRPDVVHLHSSKTGILGRLSFPPAKTVYTVHGFDSVRIGNRKFLFMEKLLKKRVRHIVGVSRYDLENLKEEGINKGVACVYNGIVDWPAISKEGREGTLPLLHEWQKEKKFIVMTIARLAAPKRFDLFCETAGNIPDKDVKFVWIGNQKPVTGLPKNIICLGSMQNAHYALKYASLFMLLSNYEGLPVSILEALAYGKPVLASRVGGISEILNNENGAALPNNAAAFAEKIRWYKANDTAYQAACLKARETYETNFTIESMYQAYLSLYKDIFENQ